MQALQAVPSFLPDYFIDTPSLHIQGVVRRRDQAPVTALLFRALTQKRKRFYMDLAAAASEFARGISRHSQIPLLDIVGWPHGLTPDFTPQQILTANRRMFADFGRPAWQVALIDPDSRLLLRPENPDAVHRPFQTSDFPELAQDHGCSFLLTGGDETRAERVDAFLNHLLEGNIHQLSTDWHFTPPLS